MQMMMIFSGVTRDTNRRKGFCNLVEGYKKINEQDEFVSESRAVECTPTKLYENKKGA